MPPPGQLKPSIMLSKHTLRYSNRFFSIQETLCFIIQPIYMFVLTECTSSMTNRSEHYLMFNLLPPSYPLLLTYLPRTIVFIFHMLRMLEKSFFNTRHTVGDYVGRLGFYSTIFISLDFFLSLLFLFNVLIGRIRSKLAISTLFLPH
jgi:hypothetical protein